MHTTFDLQRLQAVLFDFDGTLAELTLDFSVLRKRAVEALSEYATVPVSLKNPSMEELERVCAHLDAATAAKARTATLEAIVAVEIEAAKRSSLFTFVRPALAALAERGIATGIVTRNCPEAIQTVFPDVAELCACCLTRDDVARVKPHPDHLQEALDRLQCPAENALMVGDHPMDIAVGKAVGAFTAGVGTGEVPLAALAEHTPTFLAKDVKELLQTMGIPLP